VSDKSCAHTQLDYMLQMYRALRDENEKLKVAFQLAAGMFLVREEMRKREREEKEKKRWSSLFCWCW
jgi:hypothetical protein